MSSKEQGKFKASFISGGQRIKPIILELAYLSGLSYSQYVKKKI